MVDARLAGSPLVTLLAVTRHCDNDSVPTDVLLSQACGDRIAIGTETGTSESLLPHLRGRAEQPFRLGVLSLLVTLLAEDEEPGRLETGAASPRDDQSDDDRQADAESQAHQIQTSRPRIQSGSGGSGSTKSQG